MGRLTAVLVALCLSAPGLHAQTLRVRLVEELRIGDDEQADLEYLFATPTVMAVAEDGSFYVGEHYQKTIKHFDAEGRHLRTFGGPGEAPGEFTEFSSFIVDENGDLLVVDRLGQRITRFPSDDGNPDAKILVTDHLYQAHAAVRLSDGRIAIRTCVTPAFLRRTGRVFISIPERCPRNFPPRPLLQLSLDRKKFPSF